MTGVFCTTVIPTVGRPTLARAVLSVLDQQFDAASVEVVVVNDSGRPLPPEPWQHDPRIRVLHTDRRERCVARNSGAAAAAGRYLHFLDDDDVMLPGGMRALWQRATEAPSAIWVYGSWQSADNDGRVLDEFHPGLSGNILALLVSGEGIPLQASLLQVGGFRAAGGFDPGLCGVEDRDLGRRLALVGDVAWASPLVSRIRVGRVGSTTDWSRLAENDLLGREKALAAAGAFRRLRGSAVTAHDIGRVCRAYAASTVWNVRHGRMSDALGRAAAGAAFAQWRVVQPAFWRGVRTHVS